MKFFTERTEVLAPVSIFVLWIAIQLGLGYRHRHQVAERPRRPPLATEFPPDESGTGDGWSAVLGVRRGLKLLVTGDGDPADPLIEAWAGEPGDSSDGVAVVELAGTGLTLARVPLCSCGTRGCGNAGIQLRKQVPAGDLPALVALLRALPWTAVVPTRSNVLRGDSLAALPVQRSDGPSRPRITGRT